MTQSIKADLDTILKRIINRNEQLDQQLNAAFKNQKFSFSTLSFIASSASHYDPKRLVDAQKQIEAESQLAGITWEILCRPTITQISSGTTGPIIRA